MAAVIAEGKHVTYDLKPTRDDPTAVGTAEYADAIIEKLEAERVRTKVTVVGAGLTGRTIAQEVARRDYANVVLVDIVENLPQGIALDLNEAAPVLGYEATIRVEHYDATAGSDVVVDHRRRAAQAGHEPRRPRDDEREDRRLGHGAGARALAGRDRHRPLEPARRDVPRREERLRPADGARVRAGGDPRHRALPDVHRLGDGRVREGRARARSRRSRRPDGARRVRDDGRRRPAREARLAGSDRRDGGADAQGRRRGRGAPRHVRLVCAGGVGGADGGRGPARPEARPPLHRVPGRRVRHRRPVHGRAGQARRRRHRGDRRARPHRAGADVARQSAAAVRDVVGVLGKV